MDTRVDYDRRQYAVYSAGRAPFPAIVEVWSELLARYIDPRAERFEAKVIGVEPSVRMREVAEREHPHPRVRYVEGSAERIPLPDTSCDAALLSYVIHQVDDRQGRAPPS